MEKVILNKKGYDLPKRTMGIMQKIEDLLEIEKQYESGEIRVIECVSAEYNFLIDILGEEKTGEYLGSNDINEVDISEVSVAIVHILNTYKDKLENARMEYANKQLNNPAVKQALNIMNANQSARKQLC
ncbi:MAG: hypothetical protein RSB96_01665 [Oscillospiraceae bacterium]